MRHEQVSGEETEVPTALRNITLPWSSEKTQCIDQLAQPLMKPRVSANLIDMHICTL